MDTKKRRLTLVNAKTIDFTWQWVYEVCKGVLYDNKVDPFNLTLPEESCEDTRLLNVATTLNEALKGLKNGICIEIIKNCENGNTSIIREVWTRMTLADAVVKEVAKVLSQPKLIVVAKLGKVGNAILKTDLLTDKTYENVSSSVLFFPRDQLADTKIPVTLDIVIEFGDAKLKLKNKTSFLQKLFTDKTLADCSILTADNTEVNCHGCILATNSDVFHTMLTTGLQESHSKRIEMSDLSDVVVNALLSYLYGLEIDTSNVNLAFELLKAAHKYNIESLEGDMMYVLLNKPNCNFDMDAAVGLYFFTVNIENFWKLYEKVVDFLRSNTKTLASSATYQELLQANPKEAAMLALKLLEL